MGIVNLTSTDRKPLCQKRWLSRSRIWINNVRLQTTDITKDYRTQISDNGCYVPIIVPICNMTVREVAINSSHRKAFHSRAFKVLIRKNDSTRRQDLVIS